MAHFVYNNYIGILSKIFKIKPLESSAMVVSVCFTKFWYQINLIQW